MLIIGTVERFQCGKQRSVAASDWGSQAQGLRAGYQRLGHIRKQGSSLSRFLLGDSSLAASNDVMPDWGRRYLHLAMRRQRNIAKVAMA